MPYHMFYLAVSDECVPVHEFAELVAQACDGYTLRLEDGTDDDWVEFGLYRAGEADSFASLRRMPVGEPGTEAATQIAWMLDDVEGQEPACNVAWVREFLPRVRTVYKWLIDPISGSDDMAAVNELTEAFTDGEETAVYADFEGWTNTDGDHITWEFTDRPLGPDVWWFGLLLDGRWHHFRMGLDDKAGVECFRRGVVPADVEVTVE